MFGIRGFGDGDVNLIAFGELSTATLTGIDALCVRLRIGIDCRWLVSLVPPDFPLNMTFCALAGGRTGCWRVTWKLCDFDIQLDGLVFEPALEISIGLRGNIGGVILSKLFALMNATRVDEPEKLFRRLILVKFTSGSDSWRMCRIISAGGGGGNGSSGFVVFISFSCCCKGNGGGGKSGLGIRSKWFFGGRSGTQSSNEIMGPITIGPSKSFDKPSLFCRFSYSVADDVLFRNQKKMNLKLKNRSFKLKINKSYLRMGITGRERRGGGNGTPETFADCKLLCTMVMILLLSKVICCGTTWLVCVELDTSSFALWLFSEVWASWSSCCWWWCFAESRVVILIICDNLFGNDDRDGDCKIFAIDSFVL